MNYQVNELRIDYKEIFTLSALFFLLLFGKVGLFISFGIIFFKAISRKEWLFKALLYAFFIRFSNPVLFNVDEKISTGFSWVLVFFVFFISSSYFFRSKHKFDKFIFYLFIFSSYALITSLVKSSYWTISFLKLIAFLFGFLTMYLSLSLNSKYNWENFLYNVFVFFIVGSLPFYFIKGIGFARNDISFQGITNHPQFYGVFLAVLISFFIYYLFTLKTKSLVVYLQVKFFIVLGILELIFTDARTGIFSLLISITLVTVGYFLKNLIRSDQVIRKRGISKEFLVTLLLLILSSSIFYKEIGGKFNSIIFKKIRDANVNSNEFSDIGASRVELIERSFNNFKKSPFTGIGFGIPSSNKFSEIKRIAGIPVSAVIEKGNLLSALLEETGLIGILLFLFLIFNMLLLVFRYSELKYITLFLTMFLSNMGEMFFFSTNGVGIFVWFIMIFVYFRAKEKKLSLNNGVL